MKQSKSSAVDRFSISPGVGNKKFKVTVFFKNGASKTIGFGARDYEDYTIHKDPERKRRYIIRHAAREDWSDPTTAGFWSRWVLWNKTSFDSSVADLSKKFNITRV